MKLVLQVLFDKKIISQVFENDKGFIFQGDGLIKECEDRLKASILAIEYGKGYVDYKLGRVN